MNLDKYPLEADSKCMLFEFESNGSNGIIKKVIQYAPMESKGIYNLGFGDLDISTGEINDSVVSNNGDTYKILATVASTVLIFLDKRPKSSIYIIGSNPIRTRLYRIGISNNLIEIESSFDVFGLIDSEWELFQQQKNYEAFLIRNKKL